jgi:hypothetical protein
MSKILNKPRKKINLHKWNERNAFGDEETRIWGGMVASNAGFWHVVMAAVARLSPLLSERKRVRGGRRVGAEILNASMGHANPFGVTSG